MQIYYSEPLHTLLTLFFAIITIFIIYRGFYVFRYAQTYILSYDDTFLFDIEGERWWWDISGRAFSPFKIFRCLSFLHWVVFCCRFLYHHTLFHFTSLYCPLLFITLDYHHSHITLSHAFIEIRLSCRFSFLHYIMPFSPSSSLFSFSLVVFFSLSSILFSLFFFI